MVPWPPQPVPLAGQATKVCRKHLQIQAIRHPKETLLSVEAPVNHHCGTYPWPSTIPWQEERGEWSSVRGPMERTDCGMVPALAPWPTGSHPPGFGLSNQLQTPVGKQRKGFSTSLGKAASPAAWIALESV